MLIKIIDKWIIVDGKDVELKIIEIFDNKDDMYPYTDVQQVDKLRDKETDSVLIAKALKSYFGCNFTIENSIEEIDCELCGEFCDNINILIYKDSDMVIRNYIDNHLGANVGTTESEVINDWNKLGIKVEYLAEEE